MHDSEPRRSPSAIELLLDPETESAVRVEWQALAALGVSSLAAHTAPSNRPHITLVARVGLAPVAPEAFAAMTGFPITLGAPLLFGTGERRVLARSVVPTAELLTLRKAVFSAAGPGDDAPHTAPGEWMPHVALARRIRVADLPAALERLGEDIRGHAGAVRHWDAGAGVTTVLAELGRRQG
ncbi:2'-5' RNA ligase family protein [Microbacterium hydrocarbonoxydans]|uniref:2'-5' RNA ligase family protein n=1 Tax=Microbacterium hydrocarbonoxydans TaxID=273678 RepID=UPI00203EEA7A|nr:2'-5' RNA ligase family protein [Microbacterium hydrocarbonoxydans]MCM3778816.1 2'-5' RNA ligase family protein [Microbacterium hydrocarbonoxydans]